MIAVGVCLTSCLKNDADEANTITYSETAITSFSLTTVNRYIHTKSKAGGDSVYKVALVVGNYPFSIDHYQRLIYNTDSLPQDCDLNHVLVSIGKSSYSGNIYIKSVVGDTLYAYSSSDSINLSQPRELRVYNSSLETYRAYTLQVNVKKNASTSHLFDWQPMDAGSQGVPAAIRTGASVADGSSTGFRLSTDGGSTWTQETLGADESSDYLPTGAVGHVTFHLDPQHDSKYHLIAGRFKQNDYMCAVWRKVTVGGAGSWSCILNLPLPDDKKYPGYLPVADHISMFYDDGRIFAVLDSGKIYMSRDQGLSWQTDASLNLPAGATDHLRAAQDDEGYVWLLKEDSGALWRCDYIK